MQPQRKHHQHTPKKRNNLVIILLIVIIMLLTVIIGFLLLRPPLQPGPHHPHGHHDGLFDHDEQILHVNGMVKSFSTDNHGDVNGLNIQLTANKILPVNFKPHMARKIILAAGINSNVEISYGIRDAMDKPRYELTEIKNLKTGGRVNADELPPPPRRPDNEVTQTYIVTNPQLVYDPRGNPAGLRYRHQFFQFPPSSLSIKDLITSVKKIAVLAAPRDKNAGFVNINGDSVFHVISITIGTQTYLLR